MKDDQSKTPRPIEELLMLTTQLTSEEVERVQKYYEAHPEVTQLEIDGKIAQNPKGQVK